MKWVFIIFFNEYCIIMANWNYIVEVEHFKFKIEVEFLIQKMRIK